MFVRYEHCEENPENVENTETHTITYLKVPSFIYHSETHTYFICYNNNRQKVLRNFHIQTC